MAGEPTGSSVAMVFSAASWRKSATAWSGLYSSLAVLRTTCWPLMPPAALAALIARRMPALYSAASMAAGPVKGAMWATTRSAAPASADHATRPTQASRRLICVCLLGRCAFVILKLLIKPWGENGRQPVRDGRRRRLT